MLDPGKKPHKTYLHFPDHLRRASDSYGGKNYSARTHRAGRNSADHRSWNSMEARIGAVTLAEDVESGARTPPLWKTSPSASPQRRQNHYRSLSPTSKAQAIARGQKELMEMVSRMPESCYELSLKDLVEQPVVEAERESHADERNVFDENTYITEKEKKKRNDRKPQINRSGSIDNGGLLLKMVFPVNLGTKKQKKKNDSSTVNNCKVSPRPSVSDGSVKGADKEWWKMRLSVSSESESGRLSTNSGSTKSSGSSSGSGSIISRSSSRNSNVGCWSFIRNSH